MEERLKKISDKLVGLITSRIFILGLFLMLLTILVIYRLFVLQIVHGEEYQDNFTLKIEREKSLKATRGTIYDRNGVILAEDKLAYSVTIEDNYDANSTRDMDINNTILSLIDIVESNGDTLDSMDFNIILDENGNYQFTVSGTALLRFLADCYGHTRTDELKVKERNATPDDVMEYLCAKKMFGVGLYKKNDEGKYDFEPMAGLTKSQILKVVRIRMAMFSNSYQKYLSSTVATDVNENTVAEVMENKDTLQGVDISEDTIRVYIDDPSMSHILGYTGKISDEELAQLNEADPNQRYPHHYELNDMVGKAGIEQVMERELQGTKGSQEIFVDNLGRITETGKRIEPVAGNNLTLTIDSDLQSAIYKILEQKIAGIVVSKIRNIRSSDIDEDVEVLSKDIIIPIDDVYFALINNNVINLAHMASEAADPVETEVQEIFDEKLIATLSALRQELTETETIYNDLSQEMQEYESYIVSMLQDNNIRVFDPTLITEGDEAQEEWKNGDISLAEYLRNAIAGGYIEVTAITDETAEYSDTQEVYDALVSFIMDELIRDNKFSKNLYKYLVKDDRVTGYQICMILFEQDLISNEDGRKEMLESGSTTPYELMTDCVKRLEITPAQLALDPCTGSSVVTNPDNGEVLAMVTYPGYDDNMMANSVDADYFNKINNDLSLPLYNNATQQRTAPGSTFKPISTTAGLEEGVITTGEIITCEGIYEKVEQDTKSPKCWIYPGHHGPLNVVGGIKNSCNYYFYEVGYRLSTGTSGLYNSDMGLERLKKYCDLYGLTDTSGVEIPENTPNVSDIDSIRSAIGQGTHNYTTTQLARYVTAVANSGTVYNISILDRLTSSEDELLEDYTPAVRNQMNIQQTTWDAIHLGMMEAATTYSSFKNFPVIIAGKTGTAQQTTTRPNHALFICYAPYDRPQIAIATRIAYGYTSANAASATKDIINYYFRLQDTEDILTGVADLNMGETILD
ncbi:MAG: penicillin-binding protein [Lachnospiraceae bacterium]|nr:penicillin-binding protein [Lachnospiraceae bacterium]